MDYLWAVFAWVCWLVCLHFVAGLVWVLVGFVGFDWFGRWYAAGVSLFT